MTVEFYTTKKRRSNEVIDEAVLEELKDLAKYYNKLTNNQAISDFKVMLKKKWSGIFELCSNLLNRSSQQSHSRQSSSVDVSLVNQSTPQSSGITASGEAMDDEGEMPDMDTDLLIGDNGDSVFQNVEANASTIQDLSAIAVVPGEGELEQSGTCDQENNTSQNSVQVGKPVGEQTEGVTPSNLASESSDNADDSDDSNYENHRDSFYVMNGARVYGYKTKAVKKSMQKKVAALHGVTDDVLTGRERALMNLNNVSNHVQKEVQERLKGTKRSHANST
ncbi:hypothetical protein WA538_003576 [Blastocystis sp. DL]